MEPQSPRDGRALREVARLANAPVSRGPVKRAHSDSGIVNLAALMAEQPNWLDGALARAKGAAGSSLAPPSLARGSLAPPSLVPPSLAPTMRQLADSTVEIRRAPARSFPLVLAAMGAGLLVAAACVFALRVTMPHAAAVISAPPPAAAVPHLAAPAIPSPPPAATEVAAPIETVAAHLPATPDQAATRTESDGPPLGRHWRHGRHEARVAEARGAAPVVAKAADAPPAAAPQAAAPPPPPPHVGSALDAALRAAAGPVAVAASAPAAPAPAAAAAKTAPPPVADGRPERPSGSAVTGTLNEVLGKARKCVDGMTDASRALITFGSDGAVRKVDVTGPAASDARAAQCLRGAFSRAHVPPFSSSTYAAGVTVRPE